MNPPLVEVVRSGFVESIHRGAAVALDADGAPRVALGAIDTPVLPRSAIKPVQAAAMLHASLDMTDAELALAAGSHGGEPEHVERVLSLLARHGLDAEDLQCPPPSAAMNCSGKHAAMLATCVAAGWPTGSYLDPEHPLQLRIRALLEKLTDQAVAATAVDGCGAPVFAVTLRGLAGAFARLASGRVADAMRAHPFLVAGTGRDDTTLMRAVPGLLCKVGAEGVHAAALPDGRAGAVKIDDGAQRARTPVLVGLLRALGVDDPALDALAEPPVLGGGEPAGAVRLRPGTV